jgi:hypothetical protein
MTMATEQEHEQLRSLMTEGFLRAAGDIQSHHAAINRLAETIAAEHAKVTEMAEEIRRLKSWTGLPEKNDPRGPAPHTLWGMAATCRDLILKIWAHLGLPEDQIVPPTKGGVN